MDSEQLHMGKGQAMLTRRACRWLLQVLALAQGYSPYAMQVLCHPGTVGSRGGHTPVVMLVVGCLNPQPWCHVPLQGQRTGSMCDTNTFAVLQHRLRACCVHAWFCAEWVMGV